MSVRQNSIKVSIGLDDKGFTNGLAKIQQMTKNAFSNLSGVVSKSVGSEAFQVAGWLKGFDIIERAGSAAFGVIKQQISDAAKLQTDLIGAASSYQQLLKLSFSDSKKLAKQANQAFTKAAIGLPFAEFGKTLRAALGDDILGALYNANDVAGSIEKSAGIMSRLQVMIGGTVGTRDDQKIGLVNDLLVGSFDKIRGQEAFRNNPVLSRVFDELVAGIGGEKVFNKLSKADKVRKIIEPLANSVSDDVIEAYTNTAGGILGQFQHQLFGLDGLFSFSRDLITFLPDTSLIESITVLLKELLGTFTALAPILAGIVDPIALAFKGLIEGAALLLKPINAVLSLLGLLEPAIYGLSAGLSTLFYVGLAKFGLGALGGLGAKSPVKAVTPLSAALGGGKVATAANSFVGISNLANVLPFINTQFKVGLATVKGWGVAFKALSFATLTTSIVNFATTGIASLTAMTAQAWAFNAALLANPLTWIGLLIVGVALVVWKYWKPISEFFSGFFESMVADFQPVIDSFSWMGALVNQIILDIQILGNEISKLWGGNKKPEDGSTPEVKKSAKENGSDFYGGIKRFFGFTPNFADGNDPYGIFAAINRESKAMPSGSRPVIANDSEMILNRSQQASLLSNRGLTYSPVFNINHGVDAQEIAQISMDSLNRWWQSEVNNYA